MGKEKESREQREDGVTHCRKPALSRLGREQGCPSLCDNTIATCAVARSLNGFPVGLCGVVWLGLSLL